MKPEECSVRAALSVIGGKWKPVIARYLMLCTRRFGELRKLMPDATQKMLTQQLREMERDGLVHREIYAQVPPKVEYSLTPLGESLRSVVDAMSRWGKMFNDGSLQPDELSLHIGQIGLQQSKPLSQQDRS